MIRWPWTKRAEKAEKDAKSAKDRWERVVAQRPDVHAAATETRRQGEMNGFSNMIVASIRRQ